MAAALTRKLLQCSCTKRNVVILAMGLLLLVSVIFQIYQVSYCTRPRLGPAVHFKQRFAQELRSIHQDMVAAFVQKRKPPLKALMRIEELMYRLDPRFNVSHSRGVRVAPSKPVVCPEEYKGSISMSSYPYFHLEWVTKNCSYAKPMKSLITILINTIGYTARDQRQVSKVLDGISETYPTVDVLVAAHHKMKDILTISKKYTNVDVLSTSVYNVAKLWNQLIGKASTPYVLVARGVVHFNWLSLLERQIRVVGQTPGVSITGGSFRNLTGHWQVGCYQTQMENYVLDYQEGYFSSRNSCMFCDYLQGPFVADTKFISRIKFDESLSNQVIFDDFFLRVKEAEKLVMACPDAMYFTTDLTTKYRLEDKGIWTPLAKKWQLNRIIIPPGVTHSFSCRDINNFKCVGKVTKSYLLPVCCLKQYTDALKFFKEFSEKHNVIYELDSGTALGGVKFNGVLPWDLDIDLIVVSQNMSIFGEKDTIETFEKKGYTLKNYEPPKLNSDGQARAGYVNIYMPGKDMYFEIWGMPNATNLALNFLPPELRKPPFFTKARIRDVWVNTAYSPGLFSRGRYGKEILKHAQSWIITGTKHSYEPYKSGIFSSCEDPKHHSCLDNFPADGSIPMFVP